MHKKLIIGVLLLIIGVIIFYYVGLSHYFSVASVKAHAVYLQSKVAENYMHAALMFIGISAALIAFTLPITAPMGVVGGFLFSFWPAVLYCMIAIIVGSSISFLVIRYMLSHMMRHRYGNRLASFNTRMQKYGSAYLITLQLLTIVPYFIINTLAALAGISFLTFLLTTVIGSFPIVAIYTFAGRQLYKLQSWKDILSKEMLLLLLLLAGLALLPLIVRKLRSSKHENEHEDTF
jgi:uncharacterized membrane protein YdjX (TVP38/TMEM64 family)